MLKYQSIYDFVTAQENAMSSSVSVADNFDFNFKKHILRTILYKNSKYLEGSNELDSSNIRPYENIILPILRLHYRTEGFDVKDIEIFVDEAKNYYKSFLTRKFHTKWARENKIDNFIDELVESYVDFGAALVKKTNDSVPEVIPLASIAFCDQTSILSGPIGIEHFFSPAELKEKEKVGWGKKENGATISLDDLILLADASRENEKNQARKNDTPGKYIKVYAVYGEFPLSFYDADLSKEKYERQLQIIAFYNDARGKKEGVTLFRGKQKESPFKLVLRDKIYGRGVGLGGAEELFQPQIWVNYGGIRIKDMLDAASKIVHITDDPNFVNRNPNLNVVDNNQVLDIQDGKTVKPLEVTPRNLPLFNDYIEGKKVHAQALGAAQDPIQGESPKSGVPFSAQQLSVNQAQGIHSYRQGKLAVFVDEIYQDWILPNFVKEMTDVEFLSELSFDELNEIREQVVENQINRFRNEQVLGGELPTDPLELKQQFTEQFNKRGNKQFIKILKDEFKDLPISVRINIAGKQEYLSQMVDKLSGVFQQLLNPQMLQILSANPGLSKVFNEILEKAGLSPIQFSGLLTLGNQPLPGEQQQIPQQARSPQPQPTA